MNLTGERQEKPPFRWSDFRGALQAPRGIRDGTEALLHGDQSQVGLIPQESLLAPGSGPSALLVGMCYEANYVENRAQLFVRAGL